MADDFSGIPPVAPGVVTPSLSSTEAKFAEQRRRLEAVTRRDLSNAGVGAGGRLRMYYKDGTRGVLMGTDPTDGANKVRLDYDTGVNAMSLQPGAAVYGGRTQMRLRDLAGASFVATDEVAGFGLAHPSLSYPIASFEPIAAGMPTTQATAAVLAQGVNYVYNPTWVVGGRIRVQNGATGFTLNAFLHVVCADGTVIDSSVTSTAIATNVFQIVNFDKMVLMRAADMGRQAVAEIRIYRTGSDATLTAATAYVPRSLGVSQAYYEANPGAH